MGTIVAVPVAGYGLRMLFANTFSVDAGRCFRWTYEESTTRPMRCPSLVTTRGWWRDARGLWWAVDACAEHASHLSAVMPGPGARLGYRVAGHHVAGRQPRGGTSALAA